MQIEPADQSSATSTRPILRTGAADASGSMEENIGPRAGRAGRPPFLLPIVFVSGISTMAIQMTASRFVQPFFGSSLLIWSNLIGITMICLALGYFIGGRLGDRYPRPALLYGLTGAVAVLMALIPLLYDPFLNLTKGGGVFVGSFLGIVLLFALPLILLGCVSPFAVRLLLKTVEGAGRTVGAVSSLSTVGSILGTFLPVLWIMPTVGTRITLWLFAAVLLAFSALGLFLTRGKSFYGVEQPGQNNGLDETLSPIRPPSTSGMDDEVGRTQKSVLFPIIVICGMAVMATEMCASRLIQPYFGDSLLIWACLIGFIIIYLAIGYNLGGRLADRFPRPAFLYQLTALAALTIGLIPVISSPILTIANSGFKTVNGGLFFGALLGMILLFAAPVILLGCVSPFAVRLLVNNVQGAGRTAGMVSSLSTVGSIIGTFLPVLVFIPLVGTRNTLYIFSIVLLAFSVWGIYTVNRRRVPVYAALLGLVVVLALFVTFQIKTAPYGTLLEERESAYNYIQVVKRDDGQTDLVLNEGHAVHSIYNPNQILTRGPWDQYMITPFFAPGATEKDVKNMLMIGLGAGTVPKQLTKAYGSQVHIDGVEIDPTIIEMGRKHFDMNEPNLNAIAEDGRYYLITSAKKYDIIGVDAYKQPYIPFHLTTKEFFQQVRDHLTPNGVAVINAGAPSVSGKQDLRLAEALASTMKSVYPNVFMINLFKSSGYYNTIIVATNRPTTLDTFKQNIQSVVTNSLIKEVGMRAITTDSVQEWTGKTSDGSSPIVFTDDWAPVERLIDQVIIDYVTAGGK